MKRKSRKKTLREPSEVAEALDRLAPLEGDPVVDAVVASLRWVLREAEWREIWSELESRYAEAHEPELGS